jgi:hypothetical protein
MSSAMLTNSPLKRNGMCARGWTLAVWILILALPGVALPDPDAVTPLGTYSSITQDGEHCKGYEVALWRGADLSLYGIFRACSGLVGDLRMARISAGRIDPRAETISFEADLSLGMDYVAGGSEIPSRDHFVFDGKFQAGNLAGVVMHSDLVRPTRKPKSASLVLAKRNVSLKSYGTLAEWERAY